PRAYAERAAWGTYVSPPRELARPVTQVEAALDVDLPAGAEALLEVRGRTPLGRWTPWTEVDLGGAPGRLDPPSSTLAYRLTLLADAPGDAGPRVRGAALTLRNPWRLASYVEQAPLATPPTLRVWATREGLVGARTANGHEIQPSDHF